MKNNKKNNKKKKVIRITVDFSPELYEMLQQSESSTSLSKSALLRNAVKLQNMLLNEIKKGNEIIINDVKKKKSKELILI